MATVPSGGVALKLQGASGSSQNLISLAGGKSQEPAAVRRQNGHWFISEGCLLVDELLLVCACHGIMCPSYFKTCNRERFFVNSLFYKRLCLGGLKPPSLAEGHTEDGLTQEQWAPLTETTPPRHVASYHRGNPPWDRERGWQLERTCKKKKWSPFLSTEASLLYSCSLFCLMNMSYISFYSFMRLTFMGLELATSNPSNSCRHTHTKKKSK